MGALMITRLTVTEGASWVAYDINQSDGPVFLEKTPMDGIYKVVLRKGRYHHLGEPAGRGYFDVDLASGPSLRGIVLGAVARTRASANHGDVLELQLRAIGPR